MALLVWGLLPLRALGRRLLLPGAAALAVGLLATGSARCPWPTWPRSSSATAVGLWVSGELEQVSWVVVVAVVSIGVDIVSVFAGPTKALLAQGPVVVGYFTVAITWWGYTPHQAYRALGVSDLIFFALYLGAAARFGLRLRASLVATTASFFVTIVAAPVGAGAARLAAAGRGLPGRERGPVCGGPLRPAAKPPA